MNPLFVLLLLTKVGAEREEQKGIKAHDAPKEPPVCKVRIVNTAESPGDEDLNDWMKEKNTKMMEIVTGWKFGDPGTDGEKEPENDGDCHKLGWWSGKCEIIPVAECIEKEVCALMREGECIKKRMKRDTQSCEFFAEINKQKKDRDNSRVGGNWDEAPPFLYFDLAESPGSWFYTEGGSGPFKPEDVKGIVGKHCSQLV